MALLEQGDLGRGYMVDAASIAGYSIDEIANKLCARINGIFTARDAALSSLLAMCSLSTADIDEAKYCHRCNPDRHLGHATPSCVHCRGRDAIDGFRRALRQHRAAFGFGPRAQQKLLAQTALVNEADLAADLAAEAAAQEGNASDSESDSDDEYGVPAGAPRRSKRKSKGRLCAVDNGQFVDAAAVQVMCVCRSGTL